MREATFTQHLNHEPAVVSAFLADLRNDCTWRSEVVEVEVLTGVPGSAPTQYREWLTWEGMRAEALLTVAELADGSGLKVVANDPGYDSRSEYEFSSADGGTSLCLSVTLETCGALTLIEPFMWALVTRWLERDLNGLDDAIAAGPRHGDGPCNEGDRPSRTSP